MRIRPILMPLLLGTSLLAQPSPTSAFRTYSDNLLIIDTHIDTAGYILDEGYQLAEEHKYYETDIPRLRRGRVGAVFFGVYVQHGFPATALGNTDARVD